MIGRERDSLEQRWALYGDLRQVRNHWYWRAGWREDRAFYTWHLTFDGQADLHQLVSRLHETIEGPEVDLVPPDGLHLTMQGVGFTDEVTDEDLETIVQAARERCRELAPFRILLGPVDPDAEGVGLLIAPWAPIEELRRALRCAIRSVWEAAPEDEHGFRPHVTLAYSASDTDATSLKHRLAQLRDLTPAQADIGQAQLIALRREGRRYAWDVIATVHLGHANGRPTPSRPVAT
jgi:2'-5' RNA ligase